jgi:hypothetical protein
MTAARSAKLEALGFAWEMSAAAMRKKQSEAARDDAGWATQLAKVKKYKRRHGDCNVPRGWAEDPALGIWVNMQRAYKKKLDRGELCKGMTAARVAKLEALGFAWEMSAAAISKANWDDAGWEAQLAKLKVYQCRHGDCNVLQGWTEDKPLGKWVQNQRARKKALDSGEPRPGMTVARAAKLDALGFAWAFRR